MDALTNLRNILLLLSETLLLTHTIIILTLIMHMYMYIIHHEFQEILLYRQNYPFLSSTFVTIYAHLHTNICVHICRPFLMACYFCDTYNVHVLCIESVNKKCVLYWTLCVVYTFLLYFVWVNQRCCQYYIVSTYKVQLANTAVQQKCKALKCKPSAHIASWGHASCENAWPLEANSACPLV